jgi:hypothetical protein
VEVVDEHEHVGSGVGSPDADVVQPAVVAEGNHAGVVDPVAAGSGRGRWRSAVRFCRLR